MSFAHSVDGGRQTNTVADEDAAPLIAVVDPDGTVANWMLGLGRMFGLSVRIVTDATALGLALEDETPMGVVCGDLGGEGRQLVRLLRLLSAYDRELPILLVTGDDPETLGGIDAALELYPMPELQRAAGPVRIDAVIAFLAHAARQRGAMRLMAI